ncbi:PulJ/GspJ family protein [Pseudoalteromonas xiamenensis]|uniref:Prepilin-type N-terminal cleavage/methylation domain-containing protein n=1 Tax=Pseudoalteromonas xiamenensis TaxID=882626 RepID=A0A975HNV0_9GAMM|nr:type II secretion system protein [Pseudoalteromonas xiamenensis]QTH72595.1 prepilin-type N-terminal cleavage/methylation domain-containing protein [Pseudoalteromonas xiamenensis]
MTQFQIKPRKKRDTGFTLIEVLVASVILFSAVSVSALIYRNATMASIKATETLSFATQLKSTLSAIEDDIRVRSQSTDTKLSGQGTEDHFQYRWIAVLAEQASPPPRFDPDTGSFLPAKRSYKLWHVELTTTIAGKSKEYDFYEMGWHDEK